MTNVSSDCGRPACQLTSMADFWVEISPTFSQTFMDRLQNIEIFVRVAQTQNFTEAARQLRVARSVVTTRIQQLEEYVGGSTFPSQHARCAIDRDGARIPARLHRAGFARQRCGGPDARCQRLSCLRCRPCWRWDCSMAPRSATTGSVAPCPAPGLKRSAKNRAGRMGSRAGPARRAG